MYDVIAMFGTKEQIQKRDEFLREMQLREAKSSGLVDWGKVKGWPTNLYIDAKTWNENHLEGRLKKPIVFKNGDRLFNKPLPKDTPLNLKPRGDNWVGWAAFNEDIEVPVLTIRGMTMMGITPFECLSQRSGISRAKGHTVIGGLGLGWSFLKIHARHQVHEITVIENDWDVLKTVRKLLEINDTIPKKVNWVCGDMYVEAPKIKADFLFADIWPGYSDVSYDRERLVKSCPDIKSIWCWGKGGTRGSTSDR